MMGTDSRLHAIWTLEDLSLDGFPQNSSGKVSKTDLKKIVRDRVSNTAG